MKPRHRPKYRYFLQDSTKMSQSNRHIFYSQITISEHLFLHYSVFIYCIYRDLWQVKIGQMIDLTRSTHFTIQAKKLHWGSSNIWHILNTETGKCPEATCYYLMAKWEMVWEPLACKNTFIWLFCDKLHHREKPIIAKSKQNWKCKLGTKVISSLLSFL